LVLLAMLNLATELAVPVLPRLPMKMLFEPSMATPKG
jgi:hypothetical protein